MVDWRTLSSAETGPTGNDWTPLGTVYQATGIGNIPAAFFLARNVQQATETSDSLEKITDQHFRQN